MSQPSPVVARRVAEPSESAVVARLAAELLGPSWPDAAQRVAEPVPAPHHAETEPVPAPHDVEARFAPLKPVASMGVVLARDWAKREPVVSGPAVSSVPTASPVSGPPSMCLAKRPAAPLVRWVPDVTVPSMWRAATTASNSAPASPLDSQMASRFVARPYAPARRLASTAETERAEK